MKNWTEEQERAISYSGVKKSAIVSAAAGSGKTAVLIERVIRKLTDPINPVPADKIILVTFTRKAAAEMKNRLETALLSCADTPLMEKQLVLLEDAQITTIDAFCLNLLRENPEFILKLGMEQGFSICAEEEKALISKLALEKTLEEFYDSESFSKEDILSILAFFGNNGDLSLRRAILDAHSFAENLPFPEEWFEEQVFLYNNPDGYYDKLNLDYERFLEKEREKAISLTHENISLAEYDKTRLFLEKDLKVLTGEEISFSRANFDKNEDEIIKEAIKENREKVKEIKEALDLSEDLKSDFKNAVKRLKPIICAVIELYKIYARNFEEFKRGRNFVDFSDVKRLCLKLLKEKRAEISKNYDLIIIDEFQDGNSLEYEIFKTLDNERGNLFFVGDIKQSIYRFRGSEPEVFAAITKNPEYETIFLSKNFRSCLEVVDGVNDVFENLMTEEVGGVDYNENIKLKCGKNVSGGEDYKPELILLDKDMFGEGDLNNLGNAGETEARYIALRILEMVNAGFEVFTKDGEKRKCDFGDFAVLTSVGEANFRAFRKVFEEYDIPCFSEGARDYLSAEETGTALDLLTAIDNPYNDFSLFNVALSPIYSFTAEEIARIKAPFRNSPLYSAINAFCSPHNKLNRKDELYFKAKDFLNSLSKFRKIASVSQVSELIEEIKSEGLFLPLISKRQKRANIRLLSFYAETFSKSALDCSLPAFLKRVEGLKTIKADIKQASVCEDDNSVKLATIHKSKGLEFPVCFVARVNQKFNFGGNPNAEKRPLIKFSKSAGAVARYFDEESLCKIETLHWDCAERFNRADAISEEARKLYTAATRAESKLIFVGFAKDGKIRDNSYAEWLTKAPNLYNPDKVITIPEALKSAAQDLKNLEKIDLDLDLDLDEIAKIKENLTAEYKREVLGLIPRKLTATQVGARHEANAFNAPTDDFDEATIFPRNPLFYGEKRLTGKKRGDAYHKAMELIDFKRGDYAKQLKELEPKFSPLEYKALDFSLIEAFFDSDLGRRAIKSEKVVKEFKLYTEIEISELTGELLGENLDLKALSAFNDKPFVQGMADMFFYEDGEIVLVDYKTNRNTSPEKLRREYQGQLRIYSKAIEETTGVRVKERALYSFELGEVGV